MITSGAQGNRIGVRYGDVQRDLLPDLELELDADVGRLVGADGGLHSSGDRRLRDADDHDRHVAASSTGNTVAFTYTPNAGLDNGSVSVQVPAGWTAPQTGAGNGQITVSGGTGTNTVTITGTGPWTVRVDNVQIGDDGAGGSRR